MNSSDLTFGFAFLAGLASFLSPCVFSLVPAYVGYLSGRSVASNREDNRWLTFSHGVAFVLGFSFIFILMGGVAGALGGVLYSYLYDLNILLAKVGGVIVIIFGLYMTGVLRKLVSWLSSKFPSGPVGKITRLLVTATSFLDYDLRPQTAPDRKMGYFSSALMGVFFSAGWSPCVGPILGTITTLALQTGDVARGSGLLTAYSAGLAIPFLIAATQISLVTTLIRRYGKLMHYVEVAMGVLLIIIGFLLYNGTLAQLARFGTFDFLDNVDEITIGIYLLYILAVLAFLGLIPAWIAKNKGRSFIDWWFFGAGLFVVALPMALLLAPQEPGTEGGTKKTAPEPPKQSPT